jgi:hypothetical protein
MPISRRALLAGAGAALLAGCDGGVKRTHPKRPIHIDLYPVARFFPGSDERRAGDLEFLSSAELQCADKAFGGWSAIRVYPDGKRFLAISDQGHWMSGGMVFDQGRIVAIANAELAPLLGEDGSSLASRWEHDSESLAFDGGIAHIGIEVENRIYRYRFSDGGLDAKGQAIPLPPELADLHDLYGLESLGLMPVQSGTPGALIAIAEDAPEGNGRIPGWIIPENGAVSRFHVQKSDRFRVTDIAFLPEGDMVLMERIQSIWAPLQIRLRRVALAEVKDGAVLEGREIFRADATAQIDNFEGLSINLNAAGETIVTMISDNNFSALQRTLLMQWKLVGQAA